MDDVNGFFHRHHPAPVPRAVVQLVLLLVEAKVQLAELVATEWGLRWRAIPRFDVIYMGETDCFAFFDRMHEIEPLIELCTSEALAMMLGIRADPTALIRKYGHKQQDEGGCVRFCAGWLVWLFEL